MHEAQHKAQMDGVNDPGVPHRACCRALPLTLWFASECTASFTTQILKELYENDVLSEEALVAWADEKENATEEERSFLVKAAPFIQWLREAESDDEETSEEEDD